MRGGGGDPWSPVTQQAFTVPAGTYCDFAFHYEPERQNIQERIIATWPDGSPRLIEFPGQLIGTTTNLETGDSMRRSASGRAVETLSQDGAMLRDEMYGPVGFGFRQGDGYPQGYYLFHGQHVVTFDAAGTRTMVLDRGVAENVCDPLG